MGEGGWSGPARPPKGIGGAARLATKEPNVILTTSVNSVEDQRLIEEAMREIDLEQAITISPAEVKRVKDHSLSEEAGGVYYQRCGGGRRVLRKKIGGAS
jgi:hypothetical protein